ncbi:MAG: hypothetical protein ACJAVZ_004173 [Afipia broomeae]
MSNSVTFEDLRPETKFDHVFLVEQCPSSRDFSQACWGRGEHQTATPVVLKVAFYDLTTN